MKHIDEHRGYAAAKKLTVDLGGKLDAVRAEAETLRLQLANTSPAPSNAIDNAIAIMKGGVTDDLDPDVRTSVRERIAELTRQETALTRGMEAALNQFHDAAREASYQAFAEHSGDTLKLAHGQIALVRQVLECNAHIRAADAALSKKTGAHTGDLPSLEFPSPGLIEQLECWHKNYCDMVRTAESMIERRTRAKAA